MPANTASSVSRIRQVILGALQHGRQDLYYNSRTQVLAAVLLQLAKAAASPLSKSLPLQCMTERGKLSWGGQDAEPDHKIRLPQMMRKKKKSYVGINAISGMRSAS